MAPDHPSSPFMALVLTPVSSLHTTSLPLPLSRWARGNNHRVGPDIGQADCIIGQQMSNESALWIDE